MQRGFASPMWMTYKQAQLQGGQVRKGERGSMVVLARPIKVTETAETGEETERKIHLLRRYGSASRRNRDQEFLRTYSRF